MILILLITEQISDGKTEERKNGIQGQNGKTKTFHNKIGITADIAEYRKANIV